ncbi:MAG: VWA domain-containing protein [Acidobacteriota bacterium]
MRPIIITALASSLAFYGLRAQAPATPAPAPAAPVAPADGASDDIPNPPGGAVFRSSSQLVVVNVSVKDKDGKFIDNLKASDFALSEDGKPQQLRVFEFQSLTDVPLPPPPALLTPEQSAAAKQPALQAPAGPTVKPPVIVAFAPPSGNEIKYKDKRLMVLFFDMAGMPIPDQLRTQAAALKYVKTQMTEADVVAIMNYTTDLNILQDFSNDREKLLGVISKMTIGENGMEDGATGADSDADTGAAFTADQSEFNLFNTDRKLAALQSAVKMLGVFPEKKALVYFASGMTKTGTDNQAQLSATVNSALRNNVAFYPVDARGLVATAPSGDATKASSGGAGLYNGSAARSTQSQNQGQQETLYTLAADTGGKALLDSNDLSAGVVQAQKDVSSYYILGYYSTNINTDGHFRKIKVTLPKTLTAKLDYRSGYYASKSFKQFNSSDRDLQLQEALMLGDPVTDLGLAMEVNYFRMAKDRYFVPVSVKIPGSDIELARSGGAESTRLDFIGQIRDAKGNLQGTVRDNIKVQLKGEAAGELSKRNLAYDTGFTLPPGAYTLKFLARENETGKMGTYETKFSIPDLSPAMPTLPISSVVLSYQREQLSAQLASAIKDRKLVTNNPLIQNDQKLIPSVTRVFRKSGNMFVYLEAYQPDAVTTQPMLATVTFFRGKTKAFETTPLEIKDGLNTQSKAVPVRFSVPLATLEPGRYTCQVLVLNPTTQKFAVQRTAIVLLP